ncbi:MAG TPA: AcrB/AcrD/AcrF family protein, partial [Methylophaga sp.]|nr:AcrB/AcrD/AcrF family protein [Methylophaga sp.]
PSRAILTSASEVAFPELVSTLSTCIVFSPIFLLTGVAGYIFQPMAIVVIACLVASYLLSRTVVPALARLLLTNEKAVNKHSKNPLVHLHLALEQRLHNGQQHLQNTIGKLQRHIVIAPLIGVVIVTAAGFALQDLGRDFFPKTDAGLMRLY